MTSPSAPRTTRQRQAVAAALAGSDSFRTAQQIHAAIRKSGESIGLATVYRNLQAMTELGSADVVRTVDGELAYRRCESTDHHHHLVCRHCGKAVEVHTDLLEKYNDILAVEYGFTDVDHETEFYGICSDCHTK